MKCPDCRRIIADVATACRCGWIARSVEATPQCKHCEEPARMRINTETGWENVCETHYVAHASQEAAKFCASNGLQRKAGETLPEYRSRVSRWIREKAEQIARRVPNARQD